MTVDQWAKNGISASLTPITPTAGSALVGNGVSFVLTPVTTASLSSVLATGNVSGANNILMTTGQQIDAASAGAVLNIGNTNASALGIGNPSGGLSAFQIFINQGGASFSSNAGVQLSSTTANRAAFRANQFGANTGVPGVVGFKSRGTNVADLASVADGDILWRATAIGVTGNNLNVPLAGFLSIEVPTGGTNPTWVASDFTVSLVPLAGPINSIRTVFKVTSEAAADFIDGTTAPVTAAGHGAIRYNNTTPVFEFSVNGGAWTAFGGGGGGVTGTGTIGKIPKWSAATALTDSALTEAATTITSSKRVFVPEGIGGLTINALAAGSNYGEVMFQQDGVYQGSVYYQNFGGIKAIRVWSDVSTPLADDDVIVFDLVNRTVLPGSSNNQNIGSSAFRWQKLFSQIVRCNAIQDEGDINRIQLTTGGSIELRESAAATTIFSLSGTATNSVLTLGNSTAFKLVPNVSATFDIGSTSEKWRDGYFSGSVHTHYIKDSEGDQRIEIAPTAGVYIKDDSAVTRFGVDSNGVSLGNGSAIATTATVGHVKLPICAGPPTGVPGVGDGACVYDTTNNRIYVYNATVWRFVAVA